MKKKRNKIVTTINLDPKLKELAVKRGINISQTAEEAIRKRLTAADEKRLIFKEIEKHQKVIDKLQERLEDLDGVEEQIGKMTLEIALDRMSSIYERNNGVIPKTVLEFWSDQIHMPLDELQSVVRKEIMKV